MDAPLLKQLKKHILAFAYECVMGVLGLLVDFLFFCFVIMHLTTARCMVEKELLEALMKMWDDVQDGMTPLMAAAKDGHTSAVELLLSKGASVTAVDKVTIRL